MPFLWLCDFENWYDTDWKQNSKVLYYKTIYKLQIVGADTRENTLAMPFHPVWTEFRSMEPRWRQQSASVNVL